MPVVQLVLHVPSSGRYPVSCLATGLFEQANTFYVHAAIHSLTHVIDSQQADTCGAECFHFDTGTNVVDSYIKLVRKKVDRDFEPKLIHTRVGLGYILTAEP